MSKKPAKDADFELAGPRPESVIESLRSLGYDLPTAIADLIDNSIAASAKNIWLDFEWSGSRTSMVLTDDGTGMAGDELSNAMRLGSRSPLDIRGPTDLGRFGLGLKTASFSQCRRLTVISKTSRNDLECRCWDLSYVTAECDWKLLKGQQFVTPTMTLRLNQLSSGTAVVWDQLDQVVGHAKPDDESAYRFFLERIEQVKIHLAMVFHRFLSGSGAVKIQINNGVVKPWDPFLINESATQHLPEEVLIYQGGEVRVQSYVLPHHSKIDDETYKRAAGQMGWNASQGFYIYRNKRLLVPGDWLGLGFQKEEHYKLARVQVEITNGMDADWQIDVKKSRARPPGELRADLRRIARITRERAVEIYRHRGKVLARETGSPNVFPWQKCVRHGKIFYKINREHPLVRDLVDTAGDLKATIAALLRILEETIPVSYIVVNNAEHPDSLSTPFAGVPSSQIREVMLAVYQSLRHQGLSHQNARLRLSVMEPFDRFPELIASIEASESPA